MQDLRVAVIQCPLVWENVDANLAAFEDRIGALTGGRDLILLPEMFTTGFTMRPESCAVGMESRPVRWMSHMAAVAGAAVAGSMAMVEGGKFFNRFLWANPDGGIAHYDKRHLFRMGGEDRVYTAGASSPIIEHRGWRIAPFVCYDLRFPCWSRNLGNRYDAAVYVANWPEARGGQWRALLRGRAIENQCYVVACNRVGMDGNGIPYGGDSAILDPKGETMTDAAGGETILEAVLSSETLARYREKFPVWKDADECLLTGHREDHIEKS
ncbi:MAG: amidohydrolase [Spirochaetes bacterium]|nr:amidohydrolase [Spirochaetota bacterium]